MAYTTTPYATPEQVYVALGLSPAAQASDAAWILSDLLPQAQAAIDTYVGFPFQTDGSSGTPTTRVFSGNDADTLLIDPLATLKQVVEINQTTSINYGSGQIALIASPVLDISADCLLGPDNTTPGYTLRRASQLPFYFGSQNYSVSGVWGYASVPPEIVRACVRLVIHWYKQRDANYSPQTGNHQYGMQREVMSYMPPDVCRVLDKFRFPVFLAW
jgi:hypothetical protein